MHRKRLLPFCLAVCPLALALAAASAAADTYPRQTDVDAVHYVFRLTLSDASPAIRGESIATMRLAKAGVAAFELDLVSAASGKGMTVSAVTCQGVTAAFTHANNRLRIELPRPSQEAGEEVSCITSYAGVPGAGLRLLNNLYGEPTIFSENWPDNARHWLPVIDHPYDKASGEFVVTAPARFQVVANGLLTSQVDLPGDLRRTHWTQPEPIASWLYAIGMARFSVHHYASSKGIPQQSWVFPQDEAAGRGLFEFTGRRAFDYFSEQIGPYAYQKLAHVEAAGIGGGMEQATAIFYGERGVSRGSGPVVHEVAHQWWGNAVTERDWDDVWLSEGFATYFTLLYTEQFDGRDAFVRGLERSRGQILSTEEKMPDTPIVHRNLDDMSRVLNSLVYQKGGWTLHMLRGVVGTSTFWTGIRDYYRRYKHLNASTADFQTVMESAFGKDLDWFFAQWLHRSGVPALAGSWVYNAAAGQIEIELRQTQTAEPFRLPVDIGIRMEAGGAARVERVDLTGAAGRFTIAADRAPAEVVLDPNTWLLMAPPVFGPRSR